MRSSGYGRWSSILSTVTWTNETKPPDLLRGQPVEEMELDALQARTRESLFAASIQGLFRACTRNGGR